MLFLTETVGFPIPVLIMFLPEKLRSPHLRYNPKIPDVETCIKLAARQEETSTGLIVTLEAAWSGSVFGTR
jgi:hypothetical protein